MDAITIHQHFYASAPVGQMGSRGLQTVGGSPHLLSTLELRKLEGHCRYSAPPRWPIEQMPVNWGWFRFDERWVCLHRIGYSGTDDVGRPGNFMSHSLFLSTADMEAADWDVIALFEWFRSRNPITYAQPDGEHDGFVRRHDRLYERWGKEAAALRTIPEIAAPLDELRQLRSELDRTRVQRVHTPLAAALGRQRLEAIAALALREQGDTRPLLISGVRDSGRESALEQLVCEFTFDCFPIHVRRRLAFSTYHDDPQEVAVAQRNPSTHSWPHLCLRMLMNPIGEATANWSSTVKAPLLVVDAAAKLPSLANVPSVAARVAWMAQSDAPEEVAGLLAQRNFADQFDFDDECGGLADALWLYEHRGQRGAWSTRDLDRVHDFVNRLRTASDDFVSLVKFLLESVCSEPAFAAPRLATWAGDLCRILSTPRDGLHGALWIDILAPQETSKHFQQLFRETLRQVDLDATATLLDFVFSPQCASMRGELLEALASSASVCPKEGLTKLLDYWEVVERRCLERGPEADRLLRVLAAWLCHSVGKQIGDGARDERLVGVLCAAPLADAQQFVERLELLYATIAGYPAEEAIKAATDFLVRMHKAGKGDSTIVADAVSERHDLVCLMWRAWQNAAKQIPEIAEAARGVLADPLLICEYWRTERFKGSSLWHFSAREALEWLAKCGADCGQLLIQYKNEGARRLMEQLDAGLLKLPTVAGAAVAMHLQLIALAWPSLRSDHQTSPLAPDARHHLLKLCAVVLMAGYKPPRAGASAAEWVAPLAMAYRRCAHPNSTAQFFHSLGVECSRQSARAGGKRAGSQLLLSALKENLATASVEELELNWVARWFEQGFNQPSMPRGEAEPCVVSAVLLDCPDFLSREGEASELCSHVVGRIDERVWNLVIEQLGDDCRVTEFEVTKMHRWVLPGADRKSLLDKLNGQAPNANRPVTWVDDAWRQILAGTPSDDQLIAQLGKILLTDPQGLLADKCIAQLARPLERRVAELYHELFQPQAVANARDDQYSLAASEPVHLRNVPDAWKGRFLQVCRLLNVRRELVSDEQTAKLLWKCIATALISLEPGEIRQIARACGHLTFVLVPKQSDEQHSDAWKRLFLPLIKRAQHLSSRREDALHCEAAFLAIGEGLLFDHTSDIYALMATHLLRNTAWLEDRQVPAKAPRRRMSIFRKKSCPMDGIVFRLLKRRFSLETQQKLTPHWYVTRGKLAACRPNTELADLAEVYLALATQSEDSAPIPNLLALTLAGYLLRDGHASVSRRARELVRLQKPIRKAATGYRGLWEEALLKIPPALIDEGVPESDADVKSYVN